MLVPVPAEQVGQWWGRVEPELARAIRRGGRYTSESIKQALLAREMQLWLALENGALLCACVTEILTYPTAKVGNVFLAAGRDYAKWAHYMLDIEKWAKANGCDRMETLVRPGFFRVLRKIIKDLKMPHLHLEWKIG